MDSGSTTEGRWAYLDTIAVCGKFLFPGSNPCREPSGQGFRIEGPLKGGLYSEPNRTGARKNKRQRGPFHSARNFKSGGDLARRRVQNLF